MSVELKPCPFCGGHAALIRGGPGKCFAKCLFCNASGDYCARDTAIAAWNSRTPDPALEAEVKVLREALERLVNAKGLAGVRAMVAGWNVEDRPEPYAERHPSRLGATLPKTNCGAVYEQDEAMQAARAALARRASS